MNQKEHHYLIIGGAGFIGCNVADHYLTRRKDVTVLDNFHRPGSRQNVQWLKQRHGSRLHVVEADIRRDSLLLQNAVERASVVYHLAAQVAVTTSVTNPREDFEINALGAFNVLEAVRQSRSQPIVIYSSTNKVYGKMDDLMVEEAHGRYGYRHAPCGVNEARPLDFHSPYGCSKGAGDQYVIDYGRIYGLQTIVFRQSCIYGPHQFGIEDQGWLAWFSIRAMQGLPITIYGDGKQVRDVLYIDDLISAYEKAVERIDRTAGQAYNVGGGPANTLSLLELAALLKRHFPAGLEYGFDNWRPGDQRVYISDIEKAKADFGWAPVTSPEEGVARLVSWLKENRLLSEMAKPEQAAGAVA